MTSPPYRYWCKWCGNSNWLMPYIKNFNFECEYCGNTNRVIHIFTWWFTKKIGKNEGNKDMRGKEGKIRRVKLAIRELRADPEAMKELDKWMCSQSSGGKK